MGGKFFLVIFSAILAGCATSLPLPERRDEARTAPLPEPVAPPDFTGIPDWRPVDPENLLLIETLDGTVAVELSSVFAPNHAARMREAARAGFYDGLSFYRVIDGFVVQGGRGEGEGTGPLEAFPPLTREFVAPADGVAFTPMMDPDHYADQVGHVDGFAAGMNAAGDEVWALHCPGVMAMARDNDPDTGDTEFYIVTGQAPRYLDRNMSVFGRVIDGMEHVQAVQRGDRNINSGVIAPEDGPDPILSMRVAGDLPTAEQPRYEVMDTRGQAFHDAKARYRNRTHEFFFETPPAVMEACHMPAPARLVSGE
ncbi:peptidylprolyl isomerase [Maricaulis sp.]|uniref:peptidylprolyl isomerase n=1 Tax=Maricaulis sp. TaxID=1486257 RepID=UPI002630D444|nr:peptidylprolyl isomerase [Maricaulis sp.]